MQLFYEAHLKETGIFELEESQAKHALQVLRYSVGEQIWLTDGKGILAKAIIEKANAKKCMVRILELEKKDKPRNYHLHLALAPTKNWDRMEWLTEKCVEIGIDHLSFLHTQHSERKHFNLERIEKKAIAALKQSLQFYLPTIDEVQDFNVFLENNKAHQKFIAYVDAQNPQSLWQLSQSEKNYCLLIGPEGDFSPQELQKALDCGFEQVSLGKNRLRTETAALVGLHSLHLRNEKTW